MPNQNQWSVFKRLLTYLKPYKFLTFLALTFLLSTTVIKSIMRSASDSIPADWSNAFRMRADDRLYSRDQGISEQAGIPCGGE